MRTSSFLRATTCALAATLLLAACDDGGDATTAPTGGATALAAQNSATMDTARTLVTPTAATVRDTGRVVADGEFGAWPFPASLALTEAQKTQIRALRATYQQAVRADSLAAQVIYDEARAARAAGATREAVNAILEKARPLQEKQEAAFQALTQQVEQVFTEAQRTWLAEWRKCIAFTPTPQQVAQVEAIQAAYATNNAADIAAVQKVLDDVMAIRRAPGASAESIETQVRALLDGVRPARERLAAAQQAMWQQIGTIYVRPTCN